MTRTATLDGIATMERVIRDQAATVINQIHARREHPSYGYTKGKIREALAQMDGAIGLYMVMTGQANHSSVATLATFTDPLTLDRVTTARNLTDHL